MGYRQLGFSSYEAYLRSPHWLAVKREMTGSRRRRQCRICGRRQQLNIHHLTYETLGKEDIQRDLAVLCQPCHYRTHTTLTGTKVPIERETMRRRIRWLRWTNGIRSFRLGSAVNTFLYYLYETYRVRRR